MTTGWHHRNFTVFNQHWMNAQPAVTQFPNVCWVFWQIPFIFTQRSTLFPQRTSPKRVANINKGYVTVCWCLFVIRWRKFFFCPKPDQSSCWLCKSGVNTAGARFKAAESGRGLLKECLLVSSPLLLKSLLMSSSLLSLKGLCLVQDANVIHVAAFVALYYPRIFTF